tara:strand:+ start:87 stop:896 length:810 start_codon:yes stop_codon:yes gene_type:complete
MFFFLLFGFASSLECNVPHKEGHYHMTSVKSKNVVTECTFDLEGDIVYIEFERYAGSDMDSNAWMNFTFEGEPNVEVSAGTNQIIVDGQSYGLPTMTSLEFSQWFMVRFTASQISINFSPPGTINFGLIFTGEHVSHGTLCVLASTTTGMEQVVQQVTNKQPEFERPVKRKTIHELERRIRAIERKLDIDASMDENNVRKVNSISERVRDLHIGQRDLKQNHTGFSLLLEYVESTVYYCIIMIGLVCFANCVGGYISWSWYKKQSRWTL